MEMGLNLPAKYTTGWHGHGGISFGMHATEALQELVILRTEITRNRRKEGGQCATIHVKDSFHLLELLLKSELKN